MTRTKAITETVTIHVPFRIVKRGGRKEIVLPPDVPAQRKIDSTLMKALARAFRWKRMLESGEFATIAELADREGIAVSYMTRVLRMSLMAPEIIDAIVNGRQPQGMKLADLLEPFPSNWRGQASKLLNGAIMADCSHRRAPLQLIYDERIMRARDLRSFHPIPLLSQPRKRSGKPQP